MAKEMLINVSEGEECRIAVVADGHLEELYMERTSSATHVGNIYKGRVTNVEASIQAAFIDFGMGRNGFLHISDLMPTYFGKRGEDVQESVGRKMARRDRPPIQKCLRRGDEIIVQIIKEGIGTKGPTLSTYVSIPGRILVMMPGMAKNGVSRKIEDEEERRRLRQILDSLKPPKDCGFIIRTAGVGKSKADIERDLKYLARLWETLKKKRDKNAAPVELYAEGDLVTRTVRDVFTSDIERIVADNADVAHKISEFFKIATPRSKNKVDLYDQPIPLFHKYGIEREIEQMYSRHVPLPSGGSLVIDSTEAIVAIDVNSGRFRDHNDAEMTAFKTDMEAADEIARQLRLRDLGGVIICDFIDLRFERHRRELENRLNDHLKNDRAKTKMLRMSQFGIIELTRQRMRPSYKRSVYFDCPHCKGSGLVKTPESMGLDVMRRIAIAINDLKVQRVELAVCADVAYVLNNRKRGQLAALEQKYKKRIVVRIDSTLGMDELKLELYDSRDGLVFLEDLGMTPAAPGAPLSSRALPSQRTSPQPHRQQHEQRRRDDEDELDEDREELDRAEDAADREEEDEFEPMQASQPAPAAQQQSRPQQQQQQPRGQQQPQQQRGQQQGQQHRQQQHGQQQQGGQQQHGGQQFNGQSGQPGEGGGRRRRRRRGRRGRGRGRGDQNQQQGLPQQPAELVGAVVPPAEPEFDEVEPAEFEQEPPMGEAGHEVDAAPPPMEDEEPMVAPEPVTEDIGPEPEETAPAPAPVAEPVAEATPPAPVAEPVEEAPAEGKPKKKSVRGSRGGTGRTRTARKSPKQVKADKEKQPQPEAPPQPAPVVPVRTGSTDRHLMRDEPIIPPPISRPRTYRDLDHIPDDLD